MKLCLICVVSNQYNIFFNIFFPRRLGAHKQSEMAGTEQDFTATMVIMHPSYQKPFGMSHDIALLKLDRPAVLTK